MSKPNELSGENIRVLRIWQGWSQRELAVATDLTPWRIFKLEKGLCCPRAEEIHKIFEALKTGKSP